MLILGLFTARKDKIRCADGGSTYLQCQVTVQQLLSLYMLKTS